MPIPSLYVMQKVKKLTMSSTPTARRRRMTIVRNIAGARRSCYFCWKSRSSGCSAEKSDMVGMEMSGL